MAYPGRKVALEWQDFTTLDSEILRDAARSSPRDLIGPSRDGFEVAIDDTLEEFRSAEALEYVQAWQQAKGDQPFGICATKQLPPVIRSVNALNVKLCDGHFGGMDERVDSGGPVSADHPLSFAKADLELCFNRTRPELHMPSENIHFPMDFSKLRPVEVMP